MDNNFSKILDIFKKLYEDQSTTEADLQESMMGQVHQLITDLVNGNTDVYKVYAHPQGAVEQYVSELIHEYYEKIAADTGMHADDDVEKILDRALDYIKHDYQIDEESMASAEKHKTGPKFTGYWRGTDPRTPGQHMVGGASESIEEQMAREWNQYLSEFVATANTPMNPVDAKANAAELKKTANAAQKIKQAGVDIKNPQQVAITVDKAMKNVPVGQLTPQDKATTGALAKGIETVMSKGKPVDVNQIANIITKVQGTPQ